MAQHAILLTDLIEMARTAARANSETTVALAARNPTPLPVPARDASGAGSIARHIAMLGDELIHISRMPSDDPKALMREALRSIESCFAAMRT